MRAKKRRSKWVSFKIIPLTLIIVFIVIRVYVFGEVSGEVV